MQWKLQIFICYLEVRLSKTSKEFKYPVSINLSRKLYSVPSGSFKTFILKDHVVNPKPIRSLHRFPLSLGELDHALFAFPEHGSPPWAGNTVTGPPYNPLIDHWNFFFLERE